MGVGRMQAKRRWSKAYRHVVYPQLWKQMTRRSGIGGDGSPNDKTQSPTRGRMRLSSQSSISAKDLDDTQRFLFHPDGNAVFYWMGLVSIATIYNYWTVILRIAFPEIRENRSFAVLYFLDSFWDLVYLCDITFQMRTAFMMDGIPIYEVPRIVQHYTRQNQFLRDVISVLPTETLVSIMPVTEAVFMEPGTARLNRLLKFHCIYKFYDLADSRTSNPNGMRACRLTLSLVTVIHWIGCLYYIVSKFEGIGTNNWVYTADPEKQRILRKYVVCLYWSAMTLTTIGDCSPPETDLEYIFTGITFLIGVFVFATVVGNVGDVISNMNAARQEFQARMDQIKVYLTHRKVPASLQMKVKKWAEYSWSRTQATDEYRLLNMLPERLRAEIAVHVHLDTLSKVKIFENCEEEFLCELVLKLRSQIYSPGDYICRCGETGREMYIINHGKVEVVVCNPTTGVEVVVASLNEGNYFGEISLLRLEGVLNRRTADVRSIGYSELLCLSRKDLMSALVEYPEAKAVLEEQARERIKTNIQAKRTFSVDDLGGTAEVAPSPTATERQQDKVPDMTEIRTQIENIHRALKEVPERKINEIQNEVMGPGRHGLWECNHWKALALLREAELGSAVRRIAELESRLSPSCSSPLCGHMKDPLADSAQSSSCDEMELLDAAFPDGLPSAEEMLSYDCTLPFMQGCAFPTAPLLPSPDAPCFSPVLLPGIVIQDIPPVFPLASPAALTPVTPRRKLVRSFASLDSALKTPAQRRQSSPTLSSTSSEWSSSKQDSDQSDL